VISHAPEKQKARAGTRAFNVVLVFIVTEEEPRK
jgi:hypothetical protein